MINNLMAEKVFFDVFKIKINKLQTTNKHNYEICITFTNSNYINDYLAYITLYDCPEPTLMNKTVIFKVTSVQYLHTLREVVVSLHDYINDITDDLFKLKFFKDDIKLKMIVDSISKDLIEFNIEHKSADYILTLANYYGMIENNVESNHIEIDEKFKKKMEVYILSNNGVGRFLLALYNLLLEEIPFNVFKLALAMLSRHIPKIDEPYLYSQTIDTYKNILDLNLDEFKTIYFNTSTIKAFCYENLVKLIDQYISYENNVFTDINRAFENEGVKSKSILDDLKYLLTI